MKRIKLITSLSTVAAIGCATPLITTSCSSNKPSEIAWLNIKWADGTRISNKTYDIVKTSTLKSEDVSVLANTGAKVNVAGFVISSSDESIVKVDIVKENEEFKLTALKSGNVTITYDAADDQGHLGQINQSIQIIDKFEFGDAILNKAEWIKTDPLVMDIDVKQTTATITVNANKNGQKLTTQQWVDGYRVNAINVSSNKHISVTNYDEQTVQLYANENVSEAYAEDVKVQIFDKNTNLPVLTLDENGDPYELTLNVKVCCTIKE